MPAAVGGGPHGVTLNFSAAPGSQLLWDALFLVACEEEAEEKWLDTHFLQDFSRRYPQARICSLGRSFSHRGVNDSYSQGPTFPRALAF